MALSKVMNFTVRSLGKGDEDGEISQRFSRYHNTKTENQHPPCDFHTWNPYDWLYWNPKGSSYNTEKVTEAELSVFLKIIISVCSLSRRNLDLVEFVIFESRIFNQHKLEFVIFERRKMHTHLRTLLLSSSVSTERSMDMRYSMQKAT